MRTIISAAVANLTIVAAATFVILAPVHAQGQKPHLQEEGIDPTSREILRGKPDAGNPKYVAALRKELEATVKSQTLDPQRIDVLIRNLFGQQISEPKMVVLRRNLRDIATNDGFYTRLVNIALPMLQANVPLEQMKSVVTSTMMRVQLDGMRRLTEQDIETFLLYSLEFMRTIPPQLCKRLVNSEVSQQEAAYLERQYIAARSDTEFRRIMDMYNRAGMAELNDHPSPPTVEADEYSAAQKVFADVLVKRMMRSYSAQAVDRILGDTERASATEVCDFGKAVYMSILDMPAPFRRWQMQALMNELSK